MAKIHQLDELLAQKSAKAKAKPAGGFAPVAAKAAPVSEGESLIWADVDFIDDNPYQPRLNYPNDAQADMVADLNRDGQLQPALARQMPGRPGRYQLAAGHRRKYAVKNGAYIKNESGEESRIYGNAGSQQPNAREFEGKMLLVVRAEITNREMRRYAYKENKSRLDLAPLENSAFYNRMRDDLTIELREFGLISADREASWRAVGEELGENFRNVHRIARLSELPEPMQKALTPAGDEPASLNARHGRALMELHEWPREQRNLFSDIRKHGWSGSKAEAVASERKKLLNEKIPTTDSLIDEAVERELDRRERPAAERQQEEEQIQANRRGMALVDGPKAGMSTESRTTLSSEERAAIQRERGRRRDAVAQREADMALVMHLQVALRSLEDAALSIDRAKSYNSVEWNKTVLLLSKEINSEVAEVIRRNAELEANENSK